MSLESSRGPLLPTGRRAYLLREIALRGTVRAAAAAAQLAVSEGTIRRDIIALDAEGLVVRVHGGAIAVASVRRTEPAKTLIGVILPDTAYHFQRSVDGMTTAAVGQGARIVVAVSNFRADIERQQIARLVSLGVHGLVISPTHRDVTDHDFRRAMDGVDLPVVIFERAFDHSEVLAEYDSVRNDDIRGSMMAVEHLADAGHRRVGLAIYDRTPPAPLIRQGYEETVRRRKLEPALTMTLPKGDDDPDGLDIELNRVLDVCAAEGIHALLVHPDRHAARLIELASDRGVRVPEHLAIVAYDDLFAEHALVPITAITSPRRELGEVAIRTVLDRIAQHSERSTPRHLQLLPHLTLRQSSLIPAT